MDLQNIHFKPCYVIILEICKYFFNDWFYVITKYLHFRFTFRQSQLTENKKRKLINLLTLFYFFQYKADELLYKIIF